MDAARRRYDMDTKQAELKRAAKNYARAQWELAICKMRLADMTKTHKVSHPMIQALRVKVCGLDEIRFDWAEYLAELKG